MPIHITEKLHENHDIKLAISVEFNQVKDRFISSVFYFIEETHKGLSKLNEIDLGVVLSPTDLDVDDPGEDVTFGAKHLRKVLPETLFRNLIHRKVLGILQPGLSQDFEGVGHAVPHLISHLVHGLICEALHFTEIVFHFLADGFDFVFYGFLLRRMVVTILRVKRLVAVVRLNRAAPNLLLDLNPLKFGVLGKHFVVVGLSEFAHLGLDLLEEFLDVAAMAVDVSEELYNHLGDAVFPLDRVEEVL